MDKIGAISIFWFSNNLPCKMIWLSHDNSRQLSWAWAGMFEAIIFCWCLVSGLSGHLVFLVVQSLPAHYVRRPSSLARSHEFAWFIKLDELYLDREDPWYCHFHESRWIKMVFRPQHSQFFKLFFFKLAQIWLLGVPFHRVSHILV